MRSTHTIVEMQLTPEAFAEILAKLEAAGYHHAILDMGQDSPTLDMTGIGLTREPSVSESRQEAPAGLTHERRTDLDERATERRSTPGLARQGAPFADASNVATTPPPPPSPVTPGLETDPHLVDTRDRGDGQQRTYLVLSVEERAKGYVRPVRRSYKHQVCGCVTTMSDAIAETYARNPGFYSGTYCVTCREHLPVGEAGEFVWVDDGTKVGT